MLNVSSWFSTPRSYKQNKLFFLQDYCRADSRFVSSQWEMALQSNAISHWLGASLELALYCTKSYADQD